MIEKKRIGDLEFSPASYLLPKERWPENPAWDIDYWYPNGYYGRESEYIHPVVAGIEQKDWYVNPMYPFGRIHKDCFKNPQSCMTIASFNYNSHEGCYELGFVGDRPIQLTKEERDIFWELLEYGFKQLNENDTTSD